MGKTFKDDVFELIKSKELKKPLIYYVLELVDFKCSPYIRVSKYSLCKETNEVLSLTKETEYLYNMANGSTRQTTLKEFSYDRQPRIFPMKGFNNKMVSLIEVFKTDDPSLHFFYKHTDANVTLLRLLQRRISYLYPCVSNSKVKRMLFATIFFNKYSDFLITDRTLYLTFNEINDNNDIAYIDVHKLPLRELKRRILAHSGDQLSFTEIVRNIWT